MMGNVQRVIRNEDNTLDIVFETINDEVYNFSDEELELYNSIELVVRGINNLKHTKKEVKEYFFNKLLGIAQVGFVGDNPSVSFALDGVTNLKLEMLESEGAKIKNAYHLSLGLYSLVMLLILWLLFFLLEFTNVDIAYFIVFTGALIGQWLSFGARKMIFRFEDMSTIEQDRMSKPIRIIFIVLSSLVLYTILTSGIIEFKFGDFSSDNLMIWKNQLLLGFIAGLLDSKLGLTLYEKATDLTK